MSTISLMSAPAAKSFGPPQITRAPTSSSSADCPSASTSAVESSSEIALAGGRSRRITATPSVTSSRTRSGIAAHPSSGLLCASRDEVQTLVEGSGANAELGRGVGRGGLRRDGDGVAREELGRANPNGNRQELGEPLGGAPRIEVLGGLSALARDRRDLVGRELVRAAQGPDAGD